jgi:hypothetical protein
MSPSPAATTFYLPAYNFSFDATSGQLTSMQDQAPTATLIYEMNLSASVSQFDHAFRFQIDASDILLWTESDPLNPVSWDKTNPSIANATYVSGNANQLSTALEPQLYMDYVSYIAEKELGSKYLVGAFNNVQDITNSIQDRAYDTLVSTVNTDLQGQFHGEGNAYRIPDFTAGMDGSQDGSGVWVTDLSGTALWSVFAHVYEHLNDRLTVKGDNGVTHDGAPGAPTSLLRVNDTIQVQVTIVTPDLDNSIKNYGHSFNSSGVQYTPLKPDPITYLLNINLTN